MTSYSSLFYLAAIVCKLTKCLTKDKLSVLSADLLVLSDMIGNVLARQDACAKTNAFTPPSETDP